MAATTNAPSGGECFGGHAAEAADSKQVAVAVGRRCRSCCEHESLEECIKNACAPCDTVKTKFSVRNICCDVEVRLIKKILEPLKGVEGVMVNALTKLVIVTHCPIECCSPADYLIDQLNAANLGASLLSCDTGKAVVRTWAAWMQEQPEMIHVALTWILFMVGLGFTGQHPECYIYIAVTAFGAVPILRKVSISLRKRQIDMSILMTLAVGGALGSAEYRESALVVVLFISAQMVEHFAMARVSRSLNSVMQLSSVRVAKRLQDGKTVPIADLAVGDQIALRPGEECPVDGVVSRYRGTMSEAALTGEAVPIEKRKGATVVAGSMMLNGYIEVELTVPASDSTLSKIKDQVDEAQALRGRAQQLVDTFAKFWTPAILVAVFVLVVIMPLATDTEFKPWLERALVMLVLACPCALVLAAPIVTTCAIAAAARHGILIKRPDVIEQFASVVTVGVDKTGTLTCGEFVVVAVEDISGRGEADNAPRDKEITLKWAAALEAKSAHPVAAAIVSRAVGCAGEAYEGAGLPAVQKFKNVDGVGVTGEVEDGAAFVPVIAGNAKALDLAEASPADRARFEAFVGEHKDDTNIAVIIGGKLEMAIALNDTLRPDAKGAVDKLRGLGCSVTMLTGDTASAARPVAAALEIGDFKASMLPKDKHAWIVAEEAKRSKTLMLGDGINDSSALASATVGVAMGEGSMALAAKTADAVIMSNKLILLPQAMSLCRYAKRLVFFNIIFATTVKLAAVGLALGGELQLWMAVLVDVGSLLVVLLVGVTVLGKKCWDDGGKSKKKGEAFPNKEVAEDAV